MNIKGPGHMACLKLHDRRTQKEEDGTAMLPGEEAKGAGNAFPLPTPGFSTNVYVREVCNSGVAPNAWKQHPRRALSLPSPESLLHHSALEPLSLSLSLAYGI